MWAAFRIETVGKRFTTAAYYYRKFWKTFANVSILNAAVVRYSSRCVCIVCTAFYGPPLELPFQYYM